MFNFRKTFVYEKASSESEDGLSNEELEGFLSRNHKAIANSASPRVRASLLACSLFLNLLLLSFIAYMYSHRGPLNPLFPQALYSPLQHLIRYKTQLFTSGFGNQVTKYMGNSTEADEAWYALYPYTVARIPKSDADQMVNETIRIAGDEDHYPALITVFHELHCLDSIRHIYFGHTEHFDRDPDTNRKVLAPDHIDHCFDSLRQTIMCNSDITPMPYKWNHQKQKALGVLDVPHTCRDFDPLLEWMKQPEHDITGWDVTRKPSVII